tara:strand:+ start:1 stop:702 length:702 start_codon:yes stop_codon:yes gene_type:complete
MSKTKIAIAGGSGKMGNLLSNFINNKKDYEISGIYDPNNTNGEYKYFNTYQEIEGDYLFVFVSANNINEFINEIFDHINKFKGIVIGSSGISDKSIKYLENEFTKNINIVCVIPNFSIGSIFQKLISQKIQDDFDKVHIIEKHHSNKIDSPSGTSLDLINSLDKESIPIDSIRSDEYMAEQIVSFKNENEELNIEHIVTDRKAYLTGINLVLNTLSSMKGYYFGLEKILENKI